MTTSEELKNSLANQSGEISFKSIDAAAGNEDLPTEENIHDDILENFHKVYGLAKDELKKLFSNDHFNHQY